MYTPGNDKSKAQAHVTAILRKQVEGLEAAKGPKHAETMAAVEALAAQLLDVFEDEEAEPYLQRVCDYKTSELGAEHPGTLSSLFRMAELQSDLDRDAEAGALYLKVLEGRMKVLGADHPDTLESIVEYADLLEYQKQYDQAEALYNRAAESAMKVFGPDHKKTKEFQLGLKICRTNMGRGGSSRIVAPKKKGCAAALVFVAALLYFIGWQVRS